MKKLLNDIYLCIKGNKNLESKFFSLQKAIEFNDRLIDILIDENLSYSYDLCDIAYEKAKEMSKRWEEEYLQEIADLKQLLNDKDVYINHLLSDINKRI